MTDKPFEIIQKKATQTFDPPGHPGADLDWILVIDDASRSFPKPGSVSVKTR